MRFLCLLFCFGVATCLVNPRGVLATALRLTGLGSSDAIACELLLPLALALRPLHQGLDPPRSHQLCLSWLRHSMRQAPLERGGQPPQRLVRTGQTQEQQEALVPELLAQQEESGQAKGSTQLLRSPPDCVANISARSLR